MCVGAGVDVDACADVGVCLLDRTGWSQSRGDSYVPGRPKIVDSVPLAKFLDWPGTWTLEKRVLTDRLLLVCVVTSKNHWQPPEAGELQTYFGALGEGEDCGGGWGAGWRRRNCDQGHWNADQTEVSPGSESQGGRGCGDEEYCHYARAWRIQNLVAKESLCHS